jgi:phosphate transport system protein
MATPVAGGALPGIDVVLGGLLEMAELAENSVRQSLHALRYLRAEDASQVFLRESTLNEREVELDDRVVRLLARGQASETDLRLLISTLRLTNDLERLGDLAVSISGRVVSLQPHKPLTPPRELKQLADAAERMVTQALQALSSRRIELAQEVLESDDGVDSLAERLARVLTDEMELDARAVQPRVQLLLASRTMERMADHATNIAEEVIFWLRGLDVRHHLRAGTG